MVKEALVTDHAPKAIGPHGQGIGAGGYVASDGDARVNEREE